MSDFNKDDVIKVARALIDNAIRWDNGNENAMFAHDGYECVYCNASEYQSEEDLNHDLDCPVLVAQDLLTTQK